jgi:hypothetical protein
MPYSGMIKIFRGNVFALIDKKTILRWEDG